MRVAGAPEVDGRVWGLSDARDGAEIDRAEPGSDVFVWLGPDRDIRGADRPGARVWKTSDPVRDRRAREPLGTPHRVRLDFRLRGVIGERPVFEATTERGAHAVAVGDAPVEQARTAATSPETIREKLGRLGETPFVLGALEIDLAPGAMLPLSMLNRARRAITDALASRASPHPTTAATHADLIESARPPERPHPASGLFVLCRNLLQAEAALDAGAAPTASWSAAWVASTADRTARFQELPTSR